MKRQGDGLLDLTAALDPAVEAALIHGRQRKAERALSKAERAKKAREREKAAKRNRVMLDIDPAIMRDLASLADQYRISQSQLASLALVLFMDAIEAGEFNLLPHLKRINNPRYEYVVNFQHNDH